MNRPFVNFSFITHGVHTCSGMCSYCSAASSMDYTMGVRTDGDMAKLKEDILRVNKRNEEEAVFDFEAWEQAILNDPVFKAQKKLAEEQKVQLNCHVDLWGADGLNNFTNLQEEVAFLRDFGERYNVKWDIHTSTNGLPCVVDEYCEYLEKENIGLQLSHDGMMQFLRTREIDPLKDIPNVAKLIKSGRLNWINCTTNFYNKSMFNNIDYFNGVLKNIFPKVWSRDIEASKEESYIYSRLYIKLNRIYDSDYDLKSKNVDGWFNGVKYKELAGMEYGDISLHNDRELADKFHFEPFAHVLDDWLYENERLFFKYFDFLKNGKLPGIGLMPYRSYVKEQLGGSRAPDIVTNNYGACHSFQSGKSNRNFVIDTIGKYCQCNLIDSSHKVLNPTAKQAEYCSTCRYRKSSECNHCGSMPPRHACEFYYRWNQLLSTTKRWLTGIDYRR